MLGGVSNGLNDAIVFLLLVASPFVLVGNIVVDAMFGKGFVDDVGFLRRGGEGGAIAFSALSSLIQIVGAAVK